MNSTGIGHVDNLDSGLGISSIHQNDSFVSNADENDHGNMKSETQQTLHSISESQTDPIMVMDSQVQVNTTANKASQTKRPSTYNKPTQTKLNIDVKMQTDPIQRLHVSTGVELVHSHNNKYTFTDDPISKHVQTYIPEVKSKSVYASYNCSMSTQTERKGKNIAGKHIFRRHKCPSPS